MNSITELGNLRFFTEKGIEIPLQKTYTIHWEIIPNEVVARNFLVNPKGHFVLDKESKSKVSIVIDDPGQLYNNTIKYTDLNNNEITISDLAKASTASTYRDTAGDTIYNNTSILFFRYYYQIERNNNKLFSNNIQDINLSNRVKLTITTLQNTIEEEYDINLIFQPKAVSTSAFGQTTVYTGSINSTYTIYSLPKSALTLTAHKGSTMLAYIIKAIIGDNSSLYPYIQYQGVVHQDKVSENFISTNTIIVYEENDAGNLITPSIIFNDDTHVRYSLQFEFQKDSEMKFISSTTEADIIWNDYFNSDEMVNNSILTLNGDTPVHFSVGFQSDTEGVYTNTMGIFLVEKDSTDITRKYFIGFINFLTEVEGEDERFRALLGNFGIPDPVKYPNIFRESEPMEQLVDWTIVNKKSKELMIYYDNIFPYVGTYKALMNALKFLGYYDIIFKEWYKIKDQNDRDRYALIQQYDFETGEPFKSKLKRINVTFGEFERYRKLNRLTMIYHLNEIDYTSGERLDFYVNRDSTYVMNKVNKYWFSYNSSQGKTTFKSSQVVDETIEYIAQDEARNAIYFETTNSYWNVNTGRQQTTNAIWESIKGNITYTPSQSGTTYKCVASIQNYDGTSTVSATSTSTKSAADAKTKATNALKAKGNNSWYKTLTSAGDKILSAWYRNSSKKPTKRSQYIDQFPTPTVEGAKQYWRDNAIPLNFIWNGFGYVGGTEAFDTYEQAYEDFLENGSITTPGENGLYKAAPVQPEWVVMDNQLIDIPTTYKLYEYRSDEVLAKLYAVKCWLEKYILGVNCYISDICGEGIIIERVKSQGYVTNHTLQDFDTEGSFTPKITDITEFQDSSSCIICSLNEFNCLRFEDYYDYSFGDFVRKEVTINPPATSDIDPVFYLSNTFETMVIADEIQYELHLDNALSGSLVEFMDSSYVDNPIYLDEGELLLWNDKKSETKFDTKESPLIYIQKGNIRNTHGEWKDAVRYAVIPILDLSTGNNIYNIIDISTGDTAVSKQKVIIKSNLSSDGSYLGELKYTSNNKWNIPLFIMKNFDICNDIDNKPVLDPNAEYILEIIEGRMEFRNTWTDIDDSSTAMNKPNGATLVFSETDYDGFDQGNEQYIGVNYVYTSEKLPVYSFGDLSNLNIRQGTGTYDVTFDEYNSEVLDPADITFGPALTNYNQFVSNFRNEYNAYKTKYQTQQAYKKTFDNFINALYENYVANNKVEVPVNRLGEYSITVKAYDAFNNIFVNKSDDKWKVTSKFINIETVANQVNSSNDFSFYNYNKDGELLDSSMADYIIQSGEPYPEFPNKYRIPDFIYDSSSNIINYDNISYAIDTPKTNDYLILNNLTERSYKIEGSASSLKIYMCDENPGRQNIFRTNEGKVGLCLYDNAQKKIIQTIVPINVNSVNIRNYDPSVALTYQTSITGSYTGDGFNDSSISELIGKDLTNTNSQLYVFNAVEIILDLDNLFIDTSNNSTIIKDGNYQSFNIGDMVSICYSLDADTHDEYDEYDVDNELAYRVADVSCIDNTYYYILDGILDLQKIDNNIYRNVNKVTLSQFSGTIYKVSPYKQISMKLCPVHLDAVQYTLRVNSDAEEYSVAYSKYNYYIMNTAFEYVPDQLLFNSYMDNTYSGFVYDYDNINLYKIWYKANQIFDMDDNLYLYENYPITIDKNRSVICFPDLDQNILTDEFYINEKIGIKYEWICRNYTINELNNWRNATNIIGKETLFRSANTFLTIAPQLLGSYQLQLKAIDIYGNVVINDGDGLLYVKDSDYMLKKKSSGDEDGSSEDENVTIESIQFIDASVKRNISSKGETVVYKDIISVRYRIIYSNRKTKVCSEESSIDGITFSVVNSSNQTQKTYTENTTSSPVTEQITIKVNEYSRNVTLTQDAGPSIVSISATCTFATIPNNINGTVSLQDYCKLYTVYANYSDGSAVNITSECPLGNPGSISVTINYDEHIKKVHTFRKTVTYHGFSDSIETDIYQDKGYIEKVQMQELGLSLDTSRVSYTGNPAYLPVITYEDGSTLDSSVATVYYKNNYITYDYSLLYSWDSLNWTDTVQTYEIPANNEEREKTYNLYVKAISNINNAKFSSTVLNIIQDAFLNIYTYTIEWTNIVPKTTVFNFSSQETTAKTTQFYISGILHTYYGTVHQSSRTIYYGQELASVGKIYSTDPNMIEYNHNTDFTVTTTAFTKVGIYYYSTLSIKPNSVNNQYSPNTVTYRNVNMSDLEATFLGPYDGHAIEANEPVDLYFSIRADQYIGGRNRTYTITFKINEGSTFDGEYVATWKAKTFTTKINVTQTSKYNENEPLNRNVNVSTSQIMTGIGYDKIFINNMNTSFIDTCTGPVYDTTRSKWHITGAWNSDNIADPTFPILSFDSDDVIMQKDMVNSVVKTNYDTYPNLDLHVFILGKPTYGPLIGTEEQYYKKQMINVKAIDSGNALTDLNTNYVTVFQKCENMDSSIYVNVRQSDEILSMLDCRVVDETIFEKISNSKQYNTSTGTYSIKAKAKGTNSSTEALTTDISVFLTSGPSVAFEVEQAGNERYEIIALTNTDGIEVGSTITLDANSSVFNFKAYRIVKDSNSSIISKTELSFDDLINKYTVKLYDSSNNAIFDSYTMNNNDVSIIGVLYQNNISYSPVEFEPL